VTSLNNSRDLIFDLKEQQPIKMTSICKKVIKELDGEIQVFTVGKKIASIEVNFVAKKLKVSSSRADVSLSLYKKIFSKITSKNRLSRYLQVE